MIVQQGTNRSEKSQIIDPEQILRSINDLIQTKNYLEARFYIELIQSQKSFSLELLTQSMRFLILVCKNNINIIILPIWITQIRKFICSSDCVNLFLQFYIEYHRHLTETLSVVELDLLTEITMNCLHNEETFILCNTAISQVVTKSDKWHSMMEHLCTQLNSKGKDLKFMERTLCIFNIVYTRNPCLELIKKFNIYECVNNLIYHNIDNSSICTQISKFYSIIAYKHQSEQLEIIQKFNLITSIMIQNIENDQAVLNVVKIIGCCMQQKKYYTAFLHLELVRFFSKWSANLNKQPQLSNKQKITVQIILSIANALLQDPQIAEQLMDQQLIELLLNILQKFKDNTEICIQCLQIISYLSVNKNFTNELFILDAFSVINQVFLIQIYNKEVSLAVISIINQIVTVDGDKIDLIILSQFNNSLNILIPALTHGQDAILFEILEYVSLISVDSIKCQILWNTDTLEKLFFLIISSEFQNNSKIMELLMNLLSIYSQISIVQQFLIKNKNNLLNLVSRHILVFEICDDFITILQNFVANESINIFSIIEDFVPTSLDIIRNQPEQQSLVLKLFDLYEQISKHNLQTRLRIQDICSTVISEFEANKIIHPYLNTLNEYIGRQSISYQNLLTKEARDYLVNGIDCKLFKDDGSVSNLLVFVTPDLASIWCKHHGDQLTKQKWRLATKHVIAIKDYLNDVDGWRQSPFKRFGKKKPDINSCFTITGNVIINKQIQLQHFHICAPSQVEKNKMFEYLRTLLQIN